MGTSTKKPSRNKSKPHRPAAKKSQPKQANSIQALRRELADAVEQQTATSEILRVISRSPTDLQPIFDTILANVTRLCEANLAAIFLYDGEVLTAAAHHNASPSFA